VTAASIARFSGIFPTEPEGPARGGNEATLHLGDGPQVCTSTEHRRDTGQDRNPDIVVRLDRVDRSLEPVRDGAVHSVACLRPIDGDRRDVIGYLIPDERFRVDGDGHVVVPEAGVTSG
jgi:hypothetical protein